MGKTAFEHVQRFVAILTKQFKLTITGVVLCDEQTFAKQFLFSFFFFFLLFEDEKSH